MTLDRAVVAVCGGCGVGGVGGGGCGHLLVLVSRS